MNSLMTYDSIFKAAGVMIRHEKWMGRPLASVILKEGYIENEETKSEPLISWKADSRNGEYRTMLYS